MSLPQKGRFLRLVRALRASMLESSVDPSAIVGAALTSWCRASFPGLPNASLPHPDAVERFAAVQAFVAFLKEEQFLEATYWLSSAYSMLAAEAYRKDLAMYFTPPSLTKRLLDDLAASGVDFRHGRFCDPACGGAAFLAPIALRIRERLLEDGATPEEVLKQVQTSVIGFDKDPTLCELSKHFLLMALHKEVQAAAELPVFQISVGDSLALAEDLFGSLDVVVCNPPFRKMSAKELAEYTGPFREVIDAQPNLYALFIALCVNLLSAKGTCALVTPTSYLSGQYFSKLREFLQSEAQVLRIGMVSGRFGVFIDVEQETALTLVKRKQPDDRNASVSVSVVSRDGTYVDVGSCELPPKGAAWPIPRTVDDVGLLERLGVSSSRLDDYGYRVKVGSFVWNRDKRTTYTSAARAAQCKDGTAVPLLWSSDIAADGTLRFDGHKKANKEPCFVNLGSMKHPSIFRKPCVLLQRVTSNDQPKRLVGALVPSSLFETYGGFVGENHVVVLEPCVDEPALSPSELVQLLSTTVVDRYFRCISGATNVSAFELNQLRLPDPKLLRAALNEGASFEEATRRALNAAEVPR